MDKVRHALEVAKTSLIIDYPFLGYISARMSFEENPDAIRFSVNPRGDVLYNRKFLQERVLKYTDGQLYLEASLRTKCCIWRFSITASTAIRRTCAQ